MCTNGCGLFIIFKSVSIRVIFGPFGLALDPAKQVRIRPDYVGSAACTQCTGNFLDQSLTFDFCDGTVGKRNTSYKNSE